MFEPLWDTFEYQPHQIDGIQWMLHRESQSEISGGILCDEMGLGKTIQMLGLMKESKEEKTLLVGPLAVLHQWADTANHCGFQVWESHPTKAEWVSYSAAAAADAPSLYVINYERMRHRPSLVDTLWSRVIFDEAHRIGNAKTRSYQVAAKITATHKWFLTATPITNTIKNVVNLFTILGVTTLPTTTHINSLKPFISEFVLCRKMEDLRSSIPSLPPSAEIVNHSLDFDTKEEEEFYRGIQGVLQKQWRLLEEENAGGTELLRIIMRLRQISIHPQVYISARKKAWRNYTREDFLTPSTKFNTLQTLIESESKQNHRWLIFCHFHEEMELLQDHLLDSIVVRECGLYSGKLNQAERESVLRKSKEPLYGIQQEVLLVQLMSGGVGLNLQHFDRIVFMGPWWTAAIMDQAIGRAVRIGQTEKVIVHHLILKEEETMNIDRVMSEKAESKRSLCNTFLSFAEGQEKQSLF